MAGPHRFKKGQSGNPKGRPKAAHDVQALARSHTKEAIETLVAIMRSDDLPSAGRCATVLLGYGWGKPMQPEQHSGPGGGPIRFTIAIDRVNSVKEPDERNP